MAGARARRLRKSRFLYAVLGVFVAVSITSWFTYGPKRSVPVRVTPIGTLAVRPNIVFILADDLSENLVPYMPHVLAMQRHGATFTNYFATDSLCCPSRTSILTGLLPHNSGVFTNTPPDGGFGTFVQRGNTARTWALAMQKSGYHTAMMGKYLNGYVPSFDAAGRRYIPRGWDDWDVTGNGYFEYRYALNQNRRLVNYGSTPHSYLTDVLSRLGSTFVSRVAPSGSGATQSRGSTRKPFVLEIATFAPHSPYVFAPRDARRFRTVQAPRTAAFDQSDSVGNPRWLKQPLLTEQEIHRINSAFRWRARSVQAIDRMIGRLERAVADAGLADNTYFVFSSDNGYHMGEHRLGPGKMTAFDTDIRIPLVIAGPGIRPGMKVSALAENIDLAPTFEQMAGAVPPPSIDGRSLIPLLEGHTPPAWRHAVLIEHHGPDLNTNDPDYPEPGSGDPPSYSAMRLDAAVYVEYVDGEREFYDIANDPDELRNVFSELSAPRRATLHAQLHALEQCHGRVSCHLADRLGSATALNTPPDRARTKLASARSAH